MGNWGIAETATEIEKLKSEFADFINGMNSCGEIDYDVYSQLFDFTMPLFDKVGDIMIKEEHNHDKFECHECGWVGDGVELTDDGECPKCYALLCDDYQ